MKRIGRIGTALAALVAGLAIGPTSNAEARSNEPVTILAVGDSKTADGRWQSEFSRLLDRVDVRHHFVTDALGGTRCDRWPSRIDELLDQHEPDLVVVLCGTNDDPAATDTAGAIRKVIRRSERAGAHVLSARISYSQPGVAPAWLLANERKTNKTLRSEFKRHDDISVADLRKIPSDARHLVDGIHGTDRGYELQGRLLFRAVRGDMGWPKPRGE